MGGAQFEWKCGLRRADRLIYSHGAAVVVLLTYLSKITEITAVYYFTFCILSVKEKKNPKMIFFLPGEEQVYRESNVLERPSNQTGKAKRKCIHLASVGD